MILEFARIDVKTFFQSYTSFHFGRKYHRIYQSWKEENLQDDESYPYVQDDDEFF